MPACGGDRTEGRPRYGATYSDLTGAACRPARVPGSTAGLRPGAGDGIGADPDCPVRYGTVRPRVQIPGPRPLSRIRIRPARRPLAPLPGPGGHSGSLSDSRGLATPASAGGSISKNVRTLLTAEDRIRGGTWAYHSTSVFSQSPRRSATYRTLSLLSSSNVACVCLMSWKRIWSGIGNGRWRHETVCRRPLVVARSIVSMVRCRRTA